VVTVERVERVERIDPVGDTALMLGLPADLGGSTNRRFFGSTGVEGAVVAFEVVGEEGAVTGFVGTVFETFKGVTLLFISLSHFRFVE